MKFWSTQRKTPLISPSSPFKRTTPKTCMSTKKVVQSLHQPRTRPECIVSNRGKSRFLLIEWPRWKHTGRKYTLRLWSTWSFKFGWTSRAGLLNWEIASKLSFRMGPCWGYAFWCCFFFSLQIDKRPIGTSAWSRLRKGICFGFRCRRRNRFASSRWPIH